MLNYNALRGYHTVFMLPVLLAGLVLTAPAQAAHIFSVNSNVDAGDTNPGDGSCVAPIGGGSLGCTLRAAVQEANALMTAATPDINVTIALPPGTFTLTGAAKEDNAASGDLDILGTCGTAFNAPCLTITGSGATGTIIDGASNDRVFHIVGSNTVKITGVTIRNGTAVGADGGGIKNTNGWVTLENCAVSSNTADGSGTVSGSSVGRSGGGGIFNGANAQMMINNCNINNNTASNPQADGSNGFLGGGGIFNSGILTLKNSYVESNTGSPFGGGIQNTSGVRLGTGKLTIEGSIIQKNSNLAAQGGGVSNYGGAVIMTRTIVRANTATGGAGIHNTNGVNQAGTVSGNVRIISGVIDSNIGGGIYNQNSMDISYSTISRNTISGNQTSGFVPGGAGIRNVAPGELAVQNSTITGNTASREGGGISNGRSMTLTSVTVSGNTSQTAGGGNEIYINTQDTTGDKTELVNTIVGGNTSSANNCAMGGDTPIGPVTAGVMTSQGYNLENGNSCGLAASTDVPNSSPNLGAMDENGNTTPDTVLLDSSHPITLMPQANSAAIGRGTCNVSKFDQRLYGRPGVSGNTCDIGAVETDGDPVVSKVDLEVTMSGNVSEVSLNNTVTHTLKVTNNGPGSAQGVTVTAQIPVEASFVSSVEDNTLGVTCTASSGQLNCNAASLPVGTSFTVFINVKPIVSPSGGFLEVRAKADVTSPNDYLPGNNGSLTDCVSGACVLTAVVPAPNNFGNSNGGGGAFSPLELLLLAAPGALLLRRRKIR